MIYCVPSQLALCSPCLDRYLPLLLIDLWREQHPEAAVAEQLPLAWEAGASASGRPLGRDRHSLDLTVKTKEGEDPQEREALLFYLLVMNLLYPNPSSRSFPPLPVRTPCSRLVWLNTRTAVVQKGGCVGEERALRLASRRNGLSRTCRFWVETEYRERMLPDSLLPRRGRP